MDGGHSTQARTEATTYTKTPRITAMDRPDAQVRMQSMESVCSSPTYFYPNRYPMPHSLWIRLGFEGSLSTLRRK